MIAFESSTKQNEKQNIGTGARKGLIEKSVKNRRGPATVMGSKSKIDHWNESFWEGLEAL
jgi:hypothetical protein